MAYYFPLRWNFSEEERIRTAQNLITLRHHLRAEIPAKTVNDTLLLATWNIRDFDSNKFRHGPRLKESYFYIAEIISAFDLVAVQEVNENLAALKNVLQILGPEWDYITTDKTEGRSGNSERMAYVFDTRKVSFQKIAGEIVLSDSRRIQRERQFARTPFLVSFRSGWFAFMVCTVHIYFGSDSGEQLERRIAEIDELTRLLARRAKDEASNYIVLGDFNIISPDHRTMNALQRHGFEVPEQLSNAASNMKLDKFYDQIAFNAREGQVKYGGHAGVFNLFESVFRSEDMPTYVPLMKNLNLLELDADNQPIISTANGDYYENIWRTFQMSDHLPMWIELKIDFAEDYLQQLIPDPMTRGATRGGTRALPDHPLSFDMPQLERL